AQTPALRAPHRGHHLAHRGRDRRRQVRRVRIQHPPLQTPRGNRAHARPPRADDFPPGGGGLGRRQRDGGEVQGGGYHGRAEEDRRGGYSDIQNRQLSSLKSRQISVCLSTV
ncbi:hypothetical protein AB1N83_010462, partial [Pleurotus pulmonarius]